jgi:hypothetical protein
MEQGDAGNRNFNTISPSAKWILLLKGHTNIPFARETAELIELPEKFTTNFDNNDLSFWARTLHFEYRYRSIDHLLADIPIKNILELSSGFSFRGLDLTRQKNVYYIDTDLPDMIDRKKELIKDLTGGDTEGKGKLEILPLNVLNEKQFYEVVSHFPPGEIVIVNEGLLMYLDIKEKEKLCGIIKKVLQERGGYWITGDIYLKIEKRNINLALDDRFNKFLEEHKVEENRFESFEAAENFFRNMGFIIDKESDLDYTSLTSLPYFIKNIPSEQLQKMSKMEKIHTTWRLRLAKVNS